MGDKIRDHISCETCGTWPPEDKAERAKWLAVLNDDGISVRELLCPLHHTPEAKAAGVKLTDL